MGRKCKDNICTLLSSKVTVDFDEKLQNIPI